MRHSISELKRSKPFTKADLIIYGIIAVLSAVSLIVFLAPKSGDLKNINVYYNDELIYTYDFVGAVGRIFPDGRCNVEERKDGEIIEVTITGSEWKNVITIMPDRAYMSFSDCSFHPMCVENFTPIKNGGEVIVCLPHNIKIVSDGKMSDEVVL